MEPHREHKRTAPTHARFAVLTISDSRTTATDQGGAEVERILRDAGHDVARRDIVRDEEGAIRATVDALLASPDIDAVVTTGGTGVARRDVTIEALEPLFDKRIPGFGEIFRALSHQEIGTSAMLSRAEGAISRGKPLFILPGSPGACRLAAERLIVPEVGHILGLLRR